MLLEEEIGPPERDFLFLFFFCGFFSLSEYKMIAQEFSISFRVNFMTLFLSIFDPETFLILFLHFLLSL